MEVSLKEGSAVGGLRGHGVGIGGTVVAQNRGVETAGEASGAKVRICADPVVCDGLVGVQNEGVALAGENLDAVDRNGHDVDAVDFDDSLNLRFSDCKRSKRLRTNHGMNIDGECVVRIAGN